MRVAAVSLAGLPVNQLSDYAAALTALLEGLHVRLAVLPAHTSFLLCSAGGHLGETGSFVESYRRFMQKPSEWNERFLAMHSDLARSSGLYLVAGTTVEQANGLSYHTAYCFGPDGKVRCRQRQTHLTREERALGLSRGGELHLFDLAGTKAGLMVGVDAFHPEVARIFALQGADLIAHSGALSAGSGNRTQPAGAPVHAELTGTSAQAELTGSSAHGRPTAVSVDVQPAGMWAQVQQNQFWAVESQLKGSICDRTFGGDCAVIGPCEVTPGSTGYLDREDTERPFAVAELVEGDRDRIRSDYPLLRLLHPHAYRVLPGLYRQGARPDCSGRPLVCDMEGD